MAGSRSKKSHSSYYGNDSTRPQGTNEGEVRKVDKLAGKRSMAYCLKLRRKWQEGGMKGPNPYPACMGK